MSDLSSFETPKSSRDTQSEAIANTIGSHFWLGIEEMKKTLSSDAPSYSDKLKKNQISPELEKREEETTQKKSL